MTFCNLSVKHKAEGKMTENEILKILKEEKANYLRLQFTDLLGINKNVEVPPSQFEKAVILVSVELYIRLRFQLQADLAPG